jgi:DNA-binding SARP family transcriptional activator
MPAVPKKSPRINPRQQVTLVTMGGVAVTGAAAPAAARLLSQPKRLAVLAYVTCSRRGGAVTRAQVMEVFWPGSDSARARNALRQTLSFIRGCLGQDALLGEGAEELQVGASLSCDALRFEELLDAGKGEDAMPHYSGAFLEGFAPRGLPVFDEWIAAHRQHLKKRAAKAAWDLAAENEARQDAAAAAFWGKRALALSPFSESEVQRLLHLLERVGDFPGALRAFNGLQQVLRTQLGASPSIETARLLTVIRTRMELAGVHHAPLTETRRRGSDRRASPRNSADRRAEPDRREGPQVP